MMYVDPWVTSLALLAKHLPIVLAWCAAGLLAITRLTGRARQLTLFAAALAVMGIAVAVVPPLVLLAGPVFADGFPFRITGLIAAVLGFAARALLVAAIFVGRPLFASDEAVAEL